MSQERDDDAPNAEPQPPVTLPARAEEFWATPDGLQAWSLPTPANMVPAMQRLGPIPLPRGRFPLMGFLASVYDHVAKCAEDTLAETSSEAG